MLDCNSADDILDQGEQILNRNEKEKGFPSLIGLDQQYNQVRVIFEPNFDKRLINLARVASGFPNQGGSGGVAGVGGENSGDFTTASQSFFPQLSFTNEEEGGIQTNQIIPGGLNISSISFIEPTSPINDKRDAVS
jgi:hypothetical protein